MRVQQFQLSVSRPEELYCPSINDGLDLRKLQVDRYQ
jgi:hypothetical protein